MIGRLARSIQPYRIILAILAEIHAQYLDKFVVQRNPKRYRHHGKSSDLVSGLILEPQLYTYGGQGRVRTKTVKKSAKVIIERYYPKLTLDFETNKRICDEIAIIASKRLRNKVGPPFQLF